VAEHADVNAWPTREDVVAWVVRTVRLYGGLHSTALRCGAEFAAAFERGEIRAPGDPPAAGRAG